MSTDGLRQLTCALLCATGVLALATDAAAQSRGLKPVADERAPTFDEQRTALVIGNGGYRAGPLKNPNADAKLVAASLRSVGFDVDERHDLDREEMVRAIRRFGDRLKEGGVGVFYFAGHGMQVDGRSYLVPIGAHIAVEADVGLEAVDATRVLARMEEADNDVNVVVLDACRNNPIASATRSREGGLAFVDAPTGTLIAYATAPGRTAADGAGQHSVYSLAFAEELRRPGLRVEDVFKRVRKRVRTATRGQQVPWESSSLEGDFFFLPKGAEAAPIADDTPAPPPKAPPPVEEVVTGSPDAFYATSPASEPPPAHLDNGDESHAPRAEDDVYGSYRLGTAAEEEMTEEQLARVAEEEQRLRADNIRYAQLKDELNEEEARKSIAGWTTVGCLSLGTASCLASIAGFAAYYQGANAYNASGQTSALWSSVMVSGCCTLTACGACTLPGLAGGLGFGTWWFVEGENVEETTVEIVRLDPDFRADEQGEGDAVEREAQSY